MRNALPGVGSRGCARRRRRRPGDGSPASAVAPVRAGPPARGRVHRERGAMRRGVRTSCGGRASGSSSRPTDSRPVPARALAVVPPPRYPLVGVVGLARRCGATTVARALAAELASRHGGAAVVASPARPAVVPLGSSAPAARLAETLARLDERRAAGRLCLAACTDAELLAARDASGRAGCDGGRARLRRAGRGRACWIASCSWHRPALEPALAAAVAETIAAVAEPPVIAVNRAHATTGRGWCTRTSWCRTRAWARGWRSRAASRAGWLGKRSSSWRTCARSG